MSADDAIEQGPETEARSDGALSRILDAAELLASAHASRAKDEASRDVSRIVSGLVLVVAAILVVAPAVLLLDVALVFLLQEKTGWGFAASSAAVAGANLLVAFGLGLTARSKFSKPVMLETRATLRRAARVLRSV